MALNPELDPLQLRQRGRPPGTRSEREAEVGYYPVASDPSDTVALRYDALAYRVAHWMFTNPGKPLTKCAREMGVSTQYLYYFVASDTFKAKYHELANGEGGFKDAMVGSLAERLRGAAYQALDQLTEQMALTPSSEYVLDASEVLIKAAVQMERPVGGGTAVQINNNFPAIPTDVLQRTQQAMLTRSSPAVIDGSVSKDDDAGLPTAK